MRPCKCVNVDLRLVKVRGVQHLGSKVQSNGGGTVCEVEDALEDG